MQEELGLFGTRFVAVEWLGKPKLAWNWDGRGPHRITRAATGGRTIDVTLHGIASHAGGAPRRGVSAVAIAALGIHDLVTGGWHGEIKKGRNYGTLNLGIIQGGTRRTSSPIGSRSKVNAAATTANSSVALCVKAERAFRRAARTLRNDKGKRGRAEVVSTVEYESFHLRDGEPCVQAAQAAIHSLGMEPELVTTRSALDANWMNFHGIPTATLGAGQVCGHSVEERLDIKQFQMGCRVGLRLATGG